MDHVLAKWLSICVPIQNDRLCNYASLQKRENDNFIDNHHQVGRVGMVVLATDHTLEMVAALYYVCGGLNSIACC